MMATSLLVRPTMRPSLPARPQSAETPNHGTAVDVQRFGFSYGPRRVLHELTFTIPRKAVTAIIGPSGCGKSTFLRSINRLNDLIPQTRHDGDITVEGMSVFRAGTEALESGRV